MNATPVENVHGIGRGVSFYSYQDAIFRGTMDLEACVVAATDAGAVGMEIIPEQSFASYPNIPDSAYAEWHRLLNAHSALPICSDLFVDIKKYRGRLLSIDESVRSLERDIRIAHRLGVGVIRVIVITPPAAVERVIPLAEELGIILGVEVHSPMRFDHRWILEHLEVMYRVDSPNFGLIPDMGIFTKVFPRLEAEQALRQGATPRLVDYIVKVYNDHPNDMETLAVEVGWRGGNARDIGLATSAMRANYLDPKSLLPHMSRIMHIHAKFWEMTEEGAEYSIPYEEIVPVLIEGGYHGYLSSEYEGAGYLEGGPTPVNSIDQVRRQQDMLARLLGENDPREVRP